MSGIVAKKMEKKLMAAFEPVDLKIIDESDQHKGHVGARPQGETHFRVHLVSKKFTGCSRIECHRMINEVLREELEGPVHALSLSAKSPQT